MHLNLRSSPGAKFRFIAQLRTMNWLPGPRLPFVALAIAAAVGIAAADFFPLPSLQPAVALAALAATAFALLVYPRAELTYLLILCGFFLLHELRTNHTPGRQLAQRLGDSPAVVSVRGTVASEPNTAAN